MKKAPIRFVIVAVILLLASCASGPQISLRQLNEGEARLTDIQMPEYVRPDLPYNVVLSIETEGSPEIRRVCFRWLSESISTNGPAVYCLPTNDTNGMGDTGSPCPNWTSTKNPSSNTFCYEASDINTEVPGRLTVKIRPTELDCDYNMLEGQVEYFSTAKGKVCMTNAVRTHVMVEK